MGVCKKCRGDITKAQYALIGEKVYKSCPDCSKTKGEHIFYPCPNDFGRTDRRITETNPLGLQSHCVKCRGNKKGPHQGAISCSELEFQNGFIISEIRFLPMSPNVFSTYIEAKKFILEDMPKRGGSYYFINSKMNCEKNALVLFQCGGYLIGYAVYDDMAFLDEPIHEGNVVYTGYYLFVSESIKLLNKPINSIDFAIIDKGFKSFNQSFQRKTVGLLPAIFGNINLYGVTTYEYDFSVILPEEIEEEYGIKLKEGYKKQIIVNAYERNIEARNRCLAYYRKLNNGRIRCEVCGFDFGKIYGKEFEGKIHIHHLKEISLIGEEYEIDAEKDLIPICPNCHMVAHSRKPAITPEKIRDLLED